MMDDILGGRTDEESQSFSSFILSPSFFPRVPHAVPYWNGATYRAVAHCLASGHVVGGIELAKLRSQIVENLGVADAVLCGSGSLALELALRACGIRDGDEVVIPTFCCSAVVPPILAVGATPVLADVGEDLNLTVETVDPVLTRKTRAIIVPHLFGNPADIEGIVELAAPRSICVIDDAAQALGASINGRPVGSFGDAGIVSFGTEKVCFGLGGGALLSRHENFPLGSEIPLAPALSSVTLQRFFSTLFWWHWRGWTLPLHSIFCRGEAGPDTPPSSYRHERLANLNAAVAVSLVETLRANIAARRARVNAYQELLGDENGLTLIAHEPGSACLTQVARVLPTRRGYDLASIVVEALADQGCEIRGSYVPIHLLPNFGKCVWERLPYSERVWPDLIELSCEPGVSLDDVERIAAILRRVVAGR
jgi:dTDP-4-amino-4,6-dideoxygalactose transaminase